METKLNKSILIMAFLAIKLNSIHCQEKTVINMADVNICGLSYENCSPDTVESILGKPISTIESAYDPDEEWGDGSLKLIYDSAFLSYLVYDVPYIESISISNKSCMIKVANGTFGVGSRLENLKGLFPESYNYFVNKNSTQSKQKTQQLQVYLLYDTGVSSFYGIMSLDLKQDKVKQVFFQLTDGN